MKPKLLGLFERSFIPLGGGDISILEILGHLGEAGFETEIHSTEFRGNENNILYHLDLMGIKYQLKNNEITYEVNKIPIKIYIEKSYYDALNKLLGVVAVSRSTLIFSYFIESLVSDISIRLPNINFIFFVNRSDFATPSGINNPVLKKYLLKQKNYIVPSEFIKNKFNETWGIKPYLLIDFIEKENYFTEKSTNNYITMINPLPEKGAAIFFEIAAAMPEKKFLAVGFWNSTKEVFEKIRDDFPNIDYVEPTRNMKEIYAQTSVLLVPSLWEEAFGRVIIEAFLNGIPVLASDTGGIPETMDGAGFIFPVKKKQGNIIPRQDYPEPWIKTLYRLDDKDFYNKVSQECLAAADRYFLKHRRSFQQFRDFITQFIR